MAHKVEVSRVVVEGDPEVEVEVLVVCEVSGRYVPASYHHPAEWPDVDVIEVVEDSEERKPRPDLLNLFASDTGVMDDACMAASDEEEAARQDAAERRADMEREDRLLGEGRWAR